MTEVPRSWLALLALIVAIGCARVETVTDHEQSSSFDEAHDTGEPAGDKR